MRIFNPLDSLSLHPKLTSFIALFALYLGLFIFFLWGYSAAAAPKASVSSAQLYSSNSSTHKLDHMVITLMEAYQKNPAKLGVVFQDLIQKYPDYNLIRVLYADWLSAKANQPPDNQALIQEVRSEVLYRYQGAVARKDIHHRLPRELIHVDRAYRYAVAVDMTNRRLYLFHNTSKGLKLIDDWYITVGKLGIDKFKEGDKKTPLGAYVLQGFVPPDTLDPMRYGDRGAWVVDYPNAMDRFEDRTGNGIWIHGSPVNSLTRVPLSSNGCISLTNQDLGHVFNLVGGAPYQNLSTPIVIAKSLTWVTQKEHRRLEKRWLSRVNRWKSAWEKNRLKDYMSFYAKGMSIRGMNKEAFKAYKHRVMKGKVHVKVGIKHLLLLESSHQSAVRMLYWQSYQSNNYNRWGNKELFWSSLSGEQTHKNIADDKPEDLSPDSIQTLPKTTYQPPHFPSSKEERRFLRGVDGYRIMLEGGIKSLLVAD